MKVKIDFKKYLNLIYYFFQIKFQSVSLIAVVMLLLLLQATFLAAAYNQCNDNELPKNGTCTCSVTHSHRSWVKCDVKYDKGNCWVLRLYNPVGPTVCK